MTSLSVLFQVQVEECYEAFCSRWPRKPEPGNSALRDGQPKWIKLVQTGGAVSGHAAF